MLRGIVRLRLSYKTSHFIHIEINQLIVHYTHFTPKTTFPFNRVSFVLPLVLPLLPFLLLSFPIFSPKLVRRFVETDPYIHVILLHYSHRQPPDQKLSAQLIFWTIAQQSNPSSDLVYFL